MESSQKTVPFDAYVLAKHEQGKACLRLLFPIIYINLVKRKLKIMPLILIRKYVSITYINNEEVSFWRLFCKEHTLIANM